MTDEPTLLLSAAGTRVLLVGSGSHAPEARVAAVPAVDGTVADLAACLIERAGLERRNITQLIDPAEPRVVAEAIDAAAREASDVLAFYYVGHSLLGRDNQLHLATRSTVDLTRGSAVYQALPYSVVRDLLSRSRARRTLVVLDCCFAGRAQGWPGSYVLAATSGDEVAWAPPGERHTAFTGALIRLLVEGDPTAPRLLTVDHVYRCLARSLRERGLPEPRRQAADRGAWPPLAVNAGYRRPVGRRLPPRADEGEHSPYRGLAAFDTDDAGFFFGRRELTDSLVRRVAEQSGTGVPLLVIGPSGAGKSSLLRAGLIPALGTRPSVVVTPGADPIERLLRQVAPDDADRLGPQIERDPARLAEVVPPDVVVVVDQFEEVFTACDEETRAAFIDALAGVCRSRSASVVIGLRADFFGLCTPYPALAEALRHPEVVCSMSREQLREVIERPAEVAGLTLDQGLADLLLEDLGISSQTAQGTVLPLLSHALLATWQRRENGVLTLSAYRATGGIAQALARTADQTLHSLSEPAQRLARRMLPRLVRLGDGTEDTRRKAPLTELIPPVGTPEHTWAREVLDMFTRARLVSVDEEGAQIVHEVLIRNWPLLRAWLDADRGDLLIRQQLTEDAADWVRLHRHADFLYGSARLSAIQEARTRWQADPGRYPRLPEEVEEFLRGSDRVARRVAIRRRAVIATLVLLLAAALAGATAAVNAASTAADQRDRALSRQLAVYSQALRVTDLTLSWLLAAAAWRIAPTGEARANLRNALLHQARGPLVTGRIDAPEGQVAAGGQVAFSPDGITLAATSVEGAIRLWDARTRKPLGRPLSAGDDNAEALVFSPDGSILVAAGDDGIARIWDTRTRRLIGRLTGHTDSVAALAFSPDGSVLASAGHDETIRLWDPRTRTQIGRPLRGHTSAVSAVAFSPHGAAIASADTDGTVQLWDARRRRQIGRPLAGKTSTTWVTGLAFSPDETILASADTDGIVRLWDVRTRNRIGRLTGHTGSVDAVAFSPDGAALASGGEDNTVRLWDVKIRKQIGLPLTGHTDSIESLAFSPEGTTLASAAVNDTVRLWHVQVREQIGWPLTGHTYTVLALAFNPDGTVLASSSSDKTVRLWDVRTRKQIGRRMTGHTGIIRAVAFSPDDRTVASASEDGTVRLWDVRTQQQIGEPMIGHTASVYSLAFSPDGTMLASGGGGGDGTLRLWDVKTRKQAGNPLAAHTHSVDAVAFSSDGTTLASGGEDGAVRLWDVRIRQQIGRPMTGHASTVYAVAFSPDGTTLASGGGDDTVRLWNVSVHRQIGQPMAGHARAVHTVAFSPDGTTLASGGGDDAVRLWDVATRQPVGQPLTGQTGTLYAVAFSPDGRTLASGGFDNTIRLRDVSTPTDLYEAVCALAGRPLTAEEWEQYLPDEPFQRICA